MHFSISRSPLGQFPAETQNRILELLIQQEGAGGGRYVESSSFRRGQTTATAAVTTTMPTTASTTERLREYRPEILNNDNFKERDTAYERTLNIFAPPSFF
jgi:hypothetical protein